MNNPEIDWLAKVVELLKGWSERDLISLATQERDVLVFLRTGLPQISESWMPARAQRGVDVPCEGR